MAGSGTVFCGGFGNEEGEHDGDTEQHEGDAIGHRGPDPVEEAACHRPGDHRDLPGGRGERDGRGERFGRDEVRDQGLLCRTEEGAGNAEGEEHGEDLADPDVAAERKDQERQGAEALDALADRDDEAAVEAVGRSAGDKDEEQRRCELDEADEPEVERIAGQVIDLPADRDADDLGGIGGGEPRDPEAREAAMAERCPGRLGRCDVGRGHDDSQGRERGPRT